MTELELIVDFHQDTDRQGPGSIHETLRAFELTGLSNREKIKIADIGCGTGASTLVLAQHTACDIVAVDLFPDFLDKLREKAKRLGISDKVSTLKQSMDDLPFDNETFDVIWSEGAIYNLGFENGVKKWKRFLKPGGYLCVSEITWIANSRPEDLETFWQREYPEIDRASNKISSLEDNGFTLAGYFYLNEESWMKNYYNPIRTRFTPFLQRHNHSDMAKSLVQEYQNEIEQYQTYKEFYSYGFYIARKN